MKRQEKVFFKQLEQKSKDNPMLKVELASKEVAILLQEYCMDGNKRVKGDLWAYVVSVLAGISCLKASVADMNDRMSDIMNDSECLPLVAVDTSMGKFYIGDLINEYLVNGRFSVLNVFYSLYKNKNRNVILPDIKNIIENNAKNIGKEDHKLWNNLHNPYEEKSKFNELYESVKKHIEPFKIEDKYMPTVYGFALTEVTDKVAGIFPKNLNCYEMIVETIVFNAHMDYLHH